MSKWLREVGAPVPDIILRGEMDKLDEGLYLGATSTEHVFGRRHTICLWWSSGKMDYRVSRVLQDLTGYIRPGKVRGTVLMTTEPEYKPFREDPDVLELIETRDLMFYLHLIHYIKLFNPTEKELTVLSLDKQSVLSDAFAKEAPRYFKSLKKAWVYVDYGRECEG